MRTLVSQKSQLTYLLWFLDIAIEFKVQRLEGDSLHLLRCIKFCLEIAFILRLVCELAAEFVEVNIYYF